MTRIAVTGHRPNKLGGYSPLVTERLLTFATELVREHPGATFITGMALGWDQAIAQACSDSGKSFVAAVPFKEQASNWPIEAQRKYDRLLLRASSIVVVSELYARGPAAAMQKRNEWMIDNCDSVLALWDGSWGGTFNCVRYAEKKKKSVQNAWHRWVDNHTQP